MFDRVDASLIEVSQCRYGRFMYLRNDKYLGHALARYGEYSEAEVDLWRQLLRPGMVAADCGANIGIHTVALSQMAALVVAFEPLSVLYHLLCGNLALNGRTNVQAFNYACGAQHDVLKVPGIDYTLQENYGGFHLHGFERGLEVPVVPLDDSVRRLDFLKADVEGMEGELLEGAARLIAECRPILYLENNPGPLQGPLIQQVAALDYELWWHHAPHFNPDNYRGEQVNDYDLTVSFNMLCLPVGHRVKVNNLERINPAHPHLIEPTEYVREAHGAHD